MNRVNEELFKKYTGRFIAQIRRFRGLSQERLAEIADVHRNTIANFEIGEKDLNIVSFSHIAQALDLGSLDYDPEQKKINGSLKPLKPFFPAEKKLLLVLGQAVDTLRRHSNLSRETLEKHTGVHRNTISRIEKAACTVRLFTLTNLYDYFKVQKVSTDMNSFTLQSLKHGRIIIPL
ncbi:MAG TPA: helix-turn-helix transcriptional regulator [Spirochaetota bacterium]|nr:helix-turn-helix transcriptional regulator [Spirochaetota bacterium]